MSGRRLLLLLAGVLVVGLVGLGALIWLVDDPTATGRADDACAAEGPAGLVGIDVDSGQVRWTNVVGGDVVALAPSSEGAGRVDAIGEGRRRTVSTASGTVLACGDGGRPPAVDGAVVGSVGLGDGSTAQQAGTAVEVTEPDGTRRWSADGRVVLAASSEGVAVRAGAGGGADGRPVQEVELRDAATGAIVWSRQIQGVAFAIGGGHLVVVDQLDGGAPEPGSTDGPARITGHRLGDGSEGWRTTVEGAVPYQAFTAGDLVLLPDGFAEHLAALDPTTGEQRWRVELPSPGRGGRWTEHGEVRAVERDGRSGVLVVAVLAAEPYRD